MREGKEGRECCERECSCSVTGRDAGIEAGWEEGGRARVKGAEKMEEIARVSMTDRQ